MKAGILASSVMESTGPWTPLNLTGLQCWLDASDAATVINTAGAVTSWNDKSGGGRHFTDGGTSTRRPVTGTRTINSLNALDFNGTSHFLLCPLATFGTLVQPISVTAVILSDAAAGTVRIFGHNTASTFNLGRSSIEWSFNAGTTRSAGTPNTSPHVLSGFFAGTSPGLRLDGVTITPNPPGANGINSQAEVGGRATGSWWDGLIAEIIVTTTNLNGTADMTSLEGYLKTKWGTP